MTLRMKSLIRRKRKNKESYERRGQSRDCPFFLHKIKGGRKPMARKSRYVDYAKGLQRLQEKEKSSTPKSILAKLKQLKGQEFSMNVPIGGTDGK